MAQENPFKSWTHTLLEPELASQRAFEASRRNIEAMSPDLDLAPQLDLDELEAQFHRLDTLESTPQASGEQPSVLQQAASTVGGNPLNANFGALLGGETAGIEQLAVMIAENLARLFEQNNVFVDRLKLEELKVDNQLMARHIYSLLQKRGIQDKQVEHLQREQKRLKKLFWKFYLRED